jgi:hypothetical protein
MARKHEGEVDYEGPQDEGGKVKPEEDPRERNISDRFPGEANEEAEQSRKNALGDKGPSRKPTPRALAEPKTVT